MAPRRPSQNRTPPSPLPACQALFFLLCTASLHPSLAQQASPLQGQGVSPCLSGYASLCKLPVYTRVELQRLQRIDERAYEFYAVVNVLQSWTDPRAESAFRLIDSKDVLKQAESRPDVYQGIQNCIAVARRGAGKGSGSAGLNLTIPTCQAVVPPPLACRKWCIMDGLTTDNPFRCCDNVWLPDIYLSNLIDITQDRLVYDRIEYLKDPVTGQPFVQRTTRVQGRYYTPLLFRAFPFDQQKLTIFFDARIEDTDALGFGIVPSATFRRLNMDIDHGSDGSLTLKRLVVNELAGWNITDITFKCTRLLDLLNDTTGTSGSISRDPGTSTSGSSGESTAERLWQQTQRSNPSDPFWANIEDAATRYTDFQKLFATCALTVQVSRLSSTLTAQSILPVAFVGSMAFVVFFSAPDLLDLRVGTEISLFLALTAVQFVFASVMPLTSYLTAFDMFILLTYSTIVVIVLESLLVYYIATRELSAGKKRTKGKTKLALEQGGAWGSVDERDPCLDGQGSAIIGQSSSIIGQDSAIIGKPIGAEAPLVVSGAEEGGAPVQSSLQGPIPAQEVKGNLLEATEPQEGNVHQGEGVVGRASGRQEGSQAGAGFSGRDGQEGKGAPRGSSGDSWRSALDRLKPPGAFSGIGQAVQQTQSRLAQDSGLGYRIARTVDMASGAVLLCVYVLLSVLNFTVGIY